MPTGELPGAARARRALADGRAAVLPNPSPLTYVVATTRPDAVNTAKGRPADQSAAAWPHDAGWDDLVPALDPAALATAYTLLWDEQSE